VSPLCRQTWYYRTIKRDDEALRLRIKKIADSRVRYGFWGIFTLLRREGWPDNHKRVYQVYCEEQLNLRTKGPKRRKAAAHRQEYPEVSSLDECWSMDFVSDQLLASRLPDSRLMLVPVEKPTKTSPCFE